MFILILIQKYFYEFLLAGGLCACAALLFRKNRNAEELERFEEKMKINKARLGNFVENQ